MLSLQLALTNVRVPAVLTSTVESYLDFGSLKNWRLTSRQGFEDVEDKIKQFLASVDRLNVIRGPFGPFLGSAWFQFMTVVYQCENCMAYESSQLCYDVQEAEEHQLCGQCFVDLCDVSVCERCSLHTKSHNGEYCTTCDTFFCYNCAHEIVGPCLSCDDLNCDECLLLDYCTQCS
jgi:hypothetical protein